MQLKEWLSERLGYDLETMRKDDVSNLLAQDIPSGCAQGTTKSASTR